MKSVRFLSVAVMSGMLAWCFVGQAKEPSKKNNVNKWVENFQDPFIGWRNRFFYKHTNVESYYVLCGSQPGTRPSNQKGMWVGARGIKPTETSFTLHIKPALGLEASYFGFGVNSHLSRLSIRFLDKDGKTIAVSCAPRTPYYSYITVAVKLKNGLKAIHFDGHGRQVSGNVNINHVEAIFGPVPKGKDYHIHELQKGQCKVIPKKQRQQQ